MTSLVDLTVLRAAVSRHRKFVAPVSKTWWLGRP